MARLFSDGGTMTVGRKQTHWTWGGFGVVIPVGSQQIEQDASIQDGYVYRPDDRGTGRAELTFGRADVQIDMNHETSDMEYTLNAASKRVEGELFYTRTIEGLGLARTRPGIDYEQGDMIEVVVWSQILDSVVSGIIDKSTAEDPHGQAVVVGEGALTDVVAYRKRNSDTWNQIARERAERLAEKARLAEQRERDEQQWRRIENNQRDLQTVTTRLDVNEDKLYDWSAAVTTQSGSWQTLYRLVNFLFGMHDSLSKAIEHTNNAFTDVYDAIENASRDNSVGTDINNAKSDISASVDDLYWAQVDRNSAGPLWGQLIQTTVNNPVREY